MKIAAYEVRPDEKPIIEGLCKEYGIDLVSTPANLDASTVDMAEGCVGVTMLGQSDLSDPIIDEQTLCKIQGYACMPRFLCS